MNMQIKKFISTYTVFLFLMLYGYSNILFAATAHKEFLLLEDNSVQQEFFDSTIGEQVVQLSDSILPFYKTLLFTKYGFIAAKDFEAHILRHTKSSLSYIKNSCNISPGLGVKEVIFPFHVFL